jgi:hypothetical protein
MDRWKETVISDHSIYYFLGDHWVTSGNERSRNWYWPNLRHYNRIWRDWGKQRNIHQDRRRHDRDSNHTPLKYKPRASTNKLGVCLEKLRTKTECLRMHVTSLLYEQVLTGKRSFELATPRLQIKWFASTVCYLM